MMPFLTRRRTVTMDQCPRCGGLLVWESDSVDFEGLRCVSCGERIDPLILAHRRVQAAREPERATPKPG